MEGDPWRELKRSMKKLRQNKRHYIYVYVNPTTFWINTESREVKKCSRPDYLVISHMSHIKFVLAPTQPSQHLLWLQLEACELSDTVEAVSYGRDQATWLPKRRSCADDAAK